MKTRRDLLTLGLLTAGSIALPQYAPAGPAASGVSELERRLAEFSRWVRLRSGVDGITEIHCGVNGLETWPHLVLPLADAGSRVRAAGSALSFHAAGQPVRVVMHALSV